MARLAAFRRLAALIVGLGVLTGLFSAGSARAAGPLDHYVRLDATAKRHGLRSTWVKPSRELRLQNRQVTLGFDADSREASWNGLRLFLGEPVRVRQRSLYVARTDLQSILQPLISPAAAKAPGRLRLIVIDAGHGGADTGAVNRALRLQEKNLTLDVARRLKRNLEARGFRVALTRATDVRLAAQQAADLEKRVQVANRAGADLFVSIHFNSLPDNSVVSGVETYALTPAGQRSTAAQSARRSDVVKQPGNRHDHWNTVLAAAIHRQLVHGLGAVDRGLKRARFAVLRTIRCPAVLVEGGFLSNRTEARNIGSAAYRQELAGAIGDGIQDYDTHLRAALARR